MEQNSSPKPFGVILNNFFKNNFLVVLFIVVGFVLYINSFHNQMFWDDDDGILKNQYIQNWQYFPKYFSENLIAGAGLLSNYWRPALLIIFSLQWHLWGDWAPGYHFINTSFHIADAIFLFFILSYIFQNRRLAILTALAFLIHPLQTEAVTYVSGLGDPLSVFFMFLGILFYLKFRISEKTLPQNKFYFASLLMYGLALMSKESSIIMPAFIFITDFFFLDQSKNISLKDKLKKSGRTIWPFLVMAGLYILARATIFNFQNTFNIYNEKNVFTSNFYIRLLTFFRILTIYFRLLVWPLDLHMERSADIITSLGSPSVILGGIIFLGLLTLAFTKFKRFPVLSFGILWFFIGLAPHSNLLALNAGLLYEHWLYLPLIGYFLVLIWLGMKVAEKYQTRKILLTTLIVVFIFFSFLTMRRNQDWSNPVTFYNQTLQYAPNSYRVVNNLGMAYSDRRDYEQAEKTYQRAIDLDPANPVAYHNLGNAYLAEGKIDLAVANFNQAISLNPKFIFSYNALASLYLKDKNYPEARKVLENYLDWSDSKIDTLFSLTQIAMEEKNFHLALDYLEKASAIDPKNQFIQTSITKVKKLIESR